MFGVWGKAKKARGGERNRPGPGFPRRAKAAPKYAYFLAPRGQIDAPLLKKRKGINGNHLRRPPLFLTSAKAAEKGRGKGFGDRNSGAKKQFSENKMQVRFEKRCRGKNSAGPRGDS